MVVKSDSDINFRLQNEEYHNIKRSSFADNVNDVTVQSLRDLLRRRVLV